MKRLILFSFPLLLLVGLVALFATQIYRDSSLIPSVLIDKPVPEFSLGPLESEGFPLPGFGTEDFQDRPEGEVTVVNVFASWCIPCRDEHEFLVRLTEEQNIRLFGINQRDAPENARTFLRELGNPYEAIGADTNNRASIEWGVYGVPETFVVNADGIITYKHIGPINAESYEQSLVPAIEAARGTSG